MTKVLFSGCDEHRNCTIKAGFASAGDPDYDAITDRRPVADRLTRIAEDNFGSVFCVLTEHLSGKLAVELEE